MGTIVKIFRQTSNKLLSKLGSRRNSQRLVLNNSMIQTTPSKQGSRSKRNKSSSRRHKCSKELAISEGYYMTAKNCLPPVQFHEVHGRFVQLSNDRFVARRVHSFCQALVFSNRTIMPNERVYVKVLKIAKGWNGTIRFGFTSIDPATLMYNVPDHACPDMTNEGRTWARALADEVVRKNSVIHFSYTTNGQILYGINNQDCGIFSANINTSQHLWFVVDIYGLTAAVELIDPRIHAMSEPVPTHRPTERHSKSGSHTIQKSPVTGPLKADASYGSTQPTRHRKDKPSPATSSPPTTRERDSSPPGRDCPICFERPINCVLYQCGHMCTCYECGVKQWRTQSRTCPICRTVIKDVIKTYMS